MKYTLTIEALPHPIPPTIRLRQRLKAALRVYGVRGTGYGQDEAPHHPPEDQRSEGRMTRKPSEGQNASESTAMALPLNDSGELHGASSGRGKHLDLT